MLFGKNRDRIVKVVSYVLGTVIILSMVFSYFAYTV